MALVRIQVPITTTGSAGSAAGTDSRAVTDGTARLIAVDLDYHPSAPAGTTDVTITSNGKAILTVTNSATDKTYYPRVPVQTAAGADIASRLEEAPIVLKDITVAVAQSNALAPAVTATFILEV